MNATDLLIIRQSPLLRTIKHQSYLVFKKFLRLTELQLYNWTIIWEDWCELWTIKTEKYTFIPIVSSILCPVFHLPYPQGISSNFTTCDALNSYFMPVCIALIFAQKQLARDWFIGCLSRGLWYHARIIRTCVSLEFFAHPRPVDISACYTRCVER